MCLKYITTVSKDNGKKKCLAHEDRMTAGSDLETLKRRGA